MIKRISTVSLLLCALFAFQPIFSQGRAPLGTQEIQGSKQIQFQNKSFRRASPAVIRDNTNSGKRLAEIIRESPDKPAGFKGITVRRIPVSGDGKFGGDIVSIDAGQSFDHINSINRILAAYIESSFQYKEADADTLATYVLYYNAAHRKDLSFFQKRYNEDLTNSLNPDKIGIDVSYRNWPGKTEIIIPINGNILKDGGSDVTTDELEEEVDRLVKDEKDPDSKKRMEEEASKMNKLQQDKLQQEKQEVDKRKEDLAKKEEELRKQEQANQNKLAETGKILQDLRKDPVKNAAKIEEKEKEVEKLQENQAKIEEEKKQVAQNKEELEKKEQEIAKKEEDRKESSSGSTASSDSGKTEPAKTEEKKPEEKVEDLQKELAEVRQELAKKEEKSENVIDDKIVFMKFIKYDTDGHYSNELWAIDPVKDDALFKSPFTNICSKEFLDIPNQGILVLGYEGTKVDDRKHKLTYLDTKTLKLKKQSDASDVFWRTPMVYTDNKIYVIEKFENNYHLTRFNPDLTVDVRSSAPVEENSEITFFKDKIYITGKGKGEGKTTIKIFARSDLKILKTLSP